MLASAAPASTLGVFGGLVRWYGTDAFWARPPLQPTPAQVALRGRAGVSPFHPGGVLVADVVHYARRRLVIADRSTWRADRLVQNPLRQHHNAEEEGVKAVLI